MSNKKEQGKRCRELLQRIEIDTRFER